MVDKSHKVNDSKCATSFSESYRIVDSYLELYLVNNVINNALQILATL